MQLYSFDVMTFTFSPRDQRLIKGLLKGRFFLVERYFLAAFFKETMRDLQPPVESE